MPSRPRDETRPQGEQELTAQLMDAARESGSRLSQQDIDRVLGLRAGDSD